MEDSTVVLDDSSYDMVTPKMASSNQIQTIQPSRPVTRLPTTPSSHSPVSPGTKYVPIPPTSNSPYFGENAHAGPSSEGAMRRDSDDFTIPLLASSAPPTPSAVALTHPPEFIHTHHPRRGSITPLGLNVISPVPPGIPNRMTGFTPIPYSPSPYDPSTSPTLSAARRGSATSTSSTLTQTRPSTFSAGRDRRRSSLTPAPATLVPPSPSRTHVSGRLSSRPTSSDGKTPHQRLIAEGNGRRGSLPQLQHLARNLYTPSLPAQPGELETTLEDYKFGAPPPSGGFGTTRSDSTSRRGGQLRDVFAEAEEEEAERQRRAFMAATYGGDGKRARERLSLGGASISPGPSVRRPSLMLWEKLGGISRDSSGPVIASTSAPALPLNTPPINDILGERRPSLPIAIPGLGRSPSYRATPEDQDIQETSETVEPQQPSQSNEDKLCVRPMPPLMPLSDPGPRQFPSNLALQRASHLLNSRNLQVEPLPHPLPPTLHPPTPVDMSEFDIDFILAGSRSQLGGKGEQKNAPVDVTPRTAKVPVTPVLKLGGEEEDSFAKFVGAFDEEYGDRRGMWSFRACATVTPVDDMRDPLDSTAPPARLGLRGEWESSGAGKFEIYANGEVRSVQSGAIWKVRKLGSREYELSNHLDVYILTSKSKHRESGGIKTRQSLSRVSSNRAHSSTVPASAAAKIRASLSDAVRLARGSDDSNATAMPNTPSSPVSFFPRRKNSRDAALELEQSLSQSYTPTAVSFSYDAKKQRSHSKDRSDENEKKKTGLGNVLKRAFKQHGHDEKKSQREEKARERAQANSWGGSASRSTSHIHPSGKLAAPPPPAHPLYPSHVDRSQSSATPSLISSGSEAAASIERGRQSSLSSVIEDDVLHEGKGWHAVPDEAVAMVLPLDEEQSQPSLLVWWVPFEPKSNPTRPSGSSKDHTPTESSTPASSEHSSSPSSGSLPKFHKLLRRRASKEKDVKIRLESKPIPDEARQAPLPFRSFRVVARVVELDELRSDNFSDHSLNPINSSSSTNHSPRKPHLGLPEDERESSSSILSGRTFPTVIAVCHSRSSGVEFVLEGLDRLGLCQGESAWGPTGYEEWRGTGLSPRGRELLDIIWVGCTGVMGIA